MNKDGFFFLRIFPLIFMLLITIICISIVTGLYLSTEDLVIANENLYLRKTVLRAANVDFPDNFNRINSIYEQQAEALSAPDGREVYKVTREDGSLSYVMPILGSGLWGPIEVMVGFTEGFAELTGIGVLSQNETPGLGARIEEDWYQSQFTGKQGPFTMVEEGTADQPKEIDAITGATRTSEAMLNIMNRAVEVGPEVLGGI
jgi:Na+-transporting NADH:ubiquinone oxidoreductase subunit C